ncbi:MAG: PASTA domain-containing protein/penicillin-binding protein [Treponematales bacterium]
MNMDCSKLNLRGIEEYAAKRLKPFIIMAAALLILLGLIALAVFSVSVRGAERAIVPDVRGKDLVSALVELQTKELYPRIQLRYSQVSQDKGLILEQDPNPGAIVKAGRRVRLVVSEGVLLSAVENYTGRNISEVRVDIQTVNTGSSGAGGPLLSIKEPYMLEFSEAPAGQILQQWPEPGAAVTGPTTLEFVVSKGPENMLIKVPQFTGLSITEALREIGRSKVDFTFLVRPLNAGERAEVVLSQEPRAGAMIPSTTRVSLTVAAPENLAPGEVFGLFSYEMPPNPYPLETRLEALLPSGERRLLLATEYSGDVLAVPYRVPEDTALILSVLNREIHRETVTSK